MSATRKPTRRAAPRSNDSKPMPYIGGKRFKSIGEQEAGTNEEHVQVTLNELPTMRLAVAMLNKDDKELAATMWGADEATVTKFTEFADGLEKIADRHKAAMELCEAARMRILIILDRCLRGPKPAPWAGRPAEKEGA